MTNENKLSGAAGRAALALFVIAVCGCGAMEPLPSDTYYRLDILSDPSADLSAGMRWTDKPVQIKKFKGNGVLRERQIAYSDADEYVVRQHQYEMWIDSPEYLLQSELVSYLRARAVSPMIGVSKPGPHRLEIQGRILQLDEIRDGDSVRVAVRLAFEVEVPGNGGGLLLGREYAETRNVGERQMSATAAAMSSAVRMIFDRFNNDVLTVLSEPAVAALVSGERD